MAEKANPLESPVCVTGASGFLGSCLVKALLDKGYTVHGTVRSLNDNGKYDYLRNLDGASKRLKLFEADLLKKGSFQKAIEGTRCVFHTASPFFFKDGTRDNLVKPALEGTENVLQSVAAVKSVECVVVTSSTAAVYVNHNTESIDPKKVYTEKDWSDVKSMEENKSWYPLSKTLAEKRAAELAAKAASYRIVCMNPTLIFGPMLQPNLNTSNAAVLAFINGTRKEIPNSAKTVVDVRDVADAHIKAYENEEAKGRYLLIAESVTWTTLCEDIKSALVAIDKKDKVASVPTKLSSEILKGGFGAPPPHHTLFDCSKAKDLGVKFRLSKEMILETVKSLRQHKHIE